jgi:hypothetical protein
VENKVDGFNTTGPNGQFTSEDFSRFCSVHALALAPLRKFHQDIQKTLLGTSFWRTLSERRSSISCGMYIPVSIMLERFKNKKPENIVAPVNKLMIELGTTKLPTELAYVPARNEKPADLLLDEAVAG